MPYKVVLFTAKITRNDCSEIVASQMQSIIDAQVDECWKYLRMEGIKALNKKIPKV